MRDDLKEPWQGVKNNGFRFPLSDLEKITKHLGPGCHHLLNKVVLGITSEYPWGLGVPSQHPQALFWVNVLRDDFAQKITSPFYA